jgi:hypothetical protein
MQSKNKKQTKRGRVQSFLGVELGDIGDGAMELKVE